MRAHWWYFFPETVSSTSGVAPLSRRVQHQSDVRPRWFRIAAFPVLQSAIWEFSSLLSCRHEGHHVMACILQDNEDYTPTHAHVKQIWSGAQHLQPLENFSVFNGFTPNTVRYAYVYFSHKSIRHCTWICRYIATFSVGLFLAWCSFATWFLLMFYLISFLVLVFSCHILTLFFSLFLTKSQFVVKDECDQ